MGNLDSSRRYLYVKVWFVKITTVGNALNFGSVFVYANLFSFQGTTCMGDQSVISVADSSSNFADHISTSRVSSEDFGSDVNVGNEVEQRETGAQRHERINVEQVGSISQCADYFLTFVKCFDFV